jgi:curved DNA-binding protein CbpA
MKSTKGGNPEFEEGQTTQWQHITQTTNDRATNTNKGWTHVLREGKQFLLHYWHPSRCSKHKAGDKSLMKKYRIVTQILGNG